MLDRLYSLYVTVIGTIKAYGDYFWTDVVEKVDEMGEQVRLGCVASADRWAGAWRGGMGRRARCAHPTPTPSPLLTSVGLPAGHPPPPTTGPTVPGAVQEAAQGAARLAGVCRLPGHHRQLPGAAAAVPGGARDDGMGEGFQVRDKVGAPAPSCSTHAARTTRRHWQACMGKAHPAPSRRRSRSMPPCTPGARKPRDARAPLARGHGHHRQGPGACRGRVQAAAPAGVQPAAAQVWGAAIGGRGGALGVAATAARLQ